MKEYRPEYYDLFRCAAAGCPDSCCHEWEIQVDEAAAEYYRSLPGELGDRLRRGLAESEGSVYFVNENGRCPMWQSDGLCRLQVELGHDALCKTCREFPRLTHDYGDFIEIGLELSCPVAAGLILSGEGAGMRCREVPMTEEPDYDPEAMEILLRTRKTALSLLSGPPNEAAARLLYYAYAVQDELDGGDPAFVCPESDLAQARAFAEKGDMGAVFAFFRELDILTRRWEDWLNGKPLSQPLPVQTLHLLRYLINRYWLQAVSDWDLTGRVKFMLVSALLIPALGGDYTLAAQTFSKEIENSADNMDALLDAMYTRACFTDARILGLLEI